MVSNTGTYLDCPFHRYSDGKDLEQLALESLVDIDAITIDAGDQMRIGVDSFIGKGLKNRAAIVRTGWAMHWNTAKYFDNHPFLTREAAVYLGECGVKLVGIDSHNIDDTRGRSRPVHTELLGAGILIVEHLCNLEKLPESGYTFSAVPPKLRGVGTFPVRAFARIRN